MANAPRIIFEVLGVASHLLLSQLAAEESLLDLFEVVAVVVHDLLDAPLPGELLRLHVLAQILQREFVFGENADESAVGEVVEHWVLL